MDRKNTIFLTVIAVATLLVAVVGATFAYFTAQIGNDANTSIDVKTSTTDTLEFATKPIYLLATQQNFANVYDGTGDDAHAGSQRVVSTSTVDYKKGGPGSTDYCYSVTVEVTSNNFVYAPAQTVFTSDQDGQNRTTTFTSKNAPELLLKITKKTEKKAKGSDQFQIVGTEIVYGDGTNNPLKGSKTSVEKGSVFSGSCTASDEEVQADCVYYESLTSQRKVCTQTNESDPTGKGISYEGDCAASADLGGFDVTVLNNTSVSDIANHEIKYIGIPTTDGGSDYKHKLTATAEGDEIRDTWTAELVFVNYNWDQQYNASPNGGEAKNFNATFKFEKLDSCGN